MPAAMLPRISSAAGPIRGAAQKIVQSRLMTSARCSRHHRPEALEELDAAGVLVGRIVLGEVVAERADGQRAGERVDDRVGDDVSVGVRVEAAREVGELDAAEDGRVARVEAVDVVAPADSDLGHASAGDCEVRDGVWSAYRSSRRQVREDPAGC